MENKKSSFEKLITQHREQFDPHTPPDNAWEKIKKSLPKKKNRLLFDTIVFWRAAAIFLLGLSTYLFVNTYSSKDTASLQGFKELEFYYSSQIHEKLALISHYQLKTGAAEDEITQNLKKLEAMYLVLKDEMQQRPTTDVRDALILNLLVRIDLINQQLQKLDKTSADVKKQKAV